VTRRPLEKKPHSVTPCLRVGQHARAWQQGCAVPGAVEHQPRIIGHDQLVHPLATNRTREVQCCRCCLERLTVGAGRSLHFSQFRLARLPNPVPLWDRGSGQGGRECPETVVGHSRTGYGRDRVPKNPGQGVGTGVQRAQKRMFSIITRPPFPAGPKPAIAPADRSRCPRLRPCRAVG
jgi:hypothetical protein